MNRNILARVWRAMGGLALATLLLAACGGAGLATPTAIPPDVVRPEQPTPSYSTAVPRISVQSATREPVFVPTPEPLLLADATSEAASQGRASLMASYLMDQPPSAMGIATGGATIVDEPGGRVVATAPAGGGLTVTGRSEDGAWLAVFTEHAIAGWVPAGSLVLYGADDLTVVTKSVAPAAVATLIAQAMTPVSTPLAILVERIPEAQAGATGATASSAVAESGSGEIVVGRIAGSGNVNLRAEPSTDATIVASLRPGADLVILGRSDDGAWLQARTPAGDGWVAASLVVAGAR